MIVADLSMTKLAHVYFNSAFIKVLLSTTSENIDIYAEEEHISYLKEKLFSEKIIYHPFKMISGLGAKVIIQDLGACRILYRIIKNTPPNESIVFLNRLPITLLLCNILNLYFRKKIYNVLHGELEYLVNPKMEGMTKYYYKIFKLGYILSSKLNTYIFLGDSIIQKTKNKAIKFGCSNFIVIDHPYHFDYNIDINSIKKDFDKHVIIGMIGTASRRKNSFMMARLKPLITRDNLSIINIGKAETDIKELLDKSEVSYFETSINSEIYESNIASLDYSLCFYNDDINLALASGSFFDSIKFAKPLLALYGNPYVDYYFDKFGDIGYRFSTIDEMAGFINNISNRELSRYKIQVENLVKAQRDLSIENIARDFKKQYTNE